ncbi:MAG: tetratricopeptide repeat protein, partial [Thermoanaerobaculia bacterium]|nr:tetratricopeptide repeat protein [Thermoanaerobaculia bacterium]
LAPLAFEVYFETGNDQKAENALALITSPAERAKLAPRVYNAGVRASQQEDLDLAMELFGQAADLDPEMVDAVQNMGAIEFNREEYAAAVPYIERLLELDPVNTEGRRLLYYSYRELDDERVNDALASFLERANTEAVGIVADNAAADFEGGRENEALEALEILVQKRPEVAIGHYRLALVLASRGRNDEAKQHLQHFLDAAPDHAEAGAARSMLEQL